MTKFGIKRATFSDIYDTSAAVSTYILTRALIIIKVINICLDASFTEYTRKIKFSKFSSLPLLCSDSVSFLIKYILGLVSQTEAKYSSLLHLLQILSYAGRLNPSFSL